MRIFLSFLGVSMDHYGVCPGPKLIKIIKGRPDVDSTAPKKFENFEKIRGLKLRHKVQCQNKRSCPVQNSAIFVIFDRHFFGS